MEESNDYWLIEMRGAVEVLTTGSGSEERDAPGIGGRMASAAEGAGSWKRNGGAPSATR